jgi:putative addiction module antidote
VTVQLKICKVGESLGVALPEEVVANLHVREGGTLVLTEAPGGGFHLAAVADEFAEQMKIAEQVGEQYRNALRELAK